ncbi:hypothetical protein C2G38_2159953 [Gigaspora rosea]|uniref:Uncharacterized protein n=1 Tax=Gigaspora rosea TaxID=44941 RepID=A0A397W0D5_9GLOM|nr:hypothetical protein C2G38_2159953 [Gigaspora rosea]
MFLGGLKDMNAALVAVVAPKSLSEAVAAARRVEAGNYYDRHNAKVAKQAGNSGSWKSAVCYKYGLGVEKE